MLLASSCFFPFLFHSSFIHSSPIFVITKWATLLVDIHCPRGGSELGISIHFFRTSCTDEADIARNLWSLVCSCLNSYWTFHLFPLLIFFSQIGSFLHWIQSVYPHLFCSLYDNGSPLYSWRFWKYGKIKLSPISQSLGLEMSKK